MSASLAEAIAQLRLKPGQTYRTTVEGHAVDIRMHETPIAVEKAEEPSQFADMVMLQPWFDIPEAPGAFIVRAQPGPLDLPDAPEIPPEEDVA